MSRRMLFNPSLSWISQLLSMAESPILKEAILWLAKIWFHRPMTAVMHPLFELSLPFFIHTLPEHYFIQYTQLVDRYAHQKRRTPEFELQNFFGQLQCILVLELPSTLQLNLAMPTTIILALIKNVKATLTDNIYYYKEPGVNEVVNLTMVQYVVGRIWDREEWAIIDQSDDVAIQADWNNLCVIFFFCLFCSLNSSNSFCH